MLVSVALATLGDFYEIFAIDIRVTNDFFIPLVTEFPPIAQLNYDAAARFAHDWMNELSINEEATFKRILMGDSLEEKLVVARDMESGAVCGFMWALYEPTLQLIVVRLLDIDLPWRGQKIGTKLLRAMWDIFPDAQECVLEAIDHPSNVSLVFYKRVGFQRLPVQKLAVFRILFPQTETALSQTFDADAYFCRLWCVRPAGV